MTDHLAALQAYIEEMKALADEGDERLKPQVAGDIEPPDESQPDYSLIWRESQYLGSTGAKMSLEDARTDIYQRIKAHVESGDGILLVRAPAGLGKSYAAIKAAQDSSQDKRILWCAARHDMFYDMSNHDVFNAGLWHHWLPIRQDDKDPSQTTCIHARAIQEWSKRGYPTIEFCKQMCIENNWISQCPYRQQSKTARNLIFGMHQHLTTGMSITDFNAVIVDELPINAFIKRRYIPAKKVLVKGAYGYIAILLRFFDHMIKTGLDIFGYKRLEGAALMRHAQGVMEQVIKEFQDGKAYENMALIPEIGQPSDVDDLDYYYVFDLIRLMIKEYSAFKAGLSDWKGRIVVTKHGINLYQRNEQWEALPDKLVILDATGEKEIYDLLFPDTKIDVYSPNVGRQGKITQVTSRLNGVTTLKPDSSHLQQAITEIKRVRERHGYGSIGIVTHQGAKEVIASQIPDAALMHFYAMRGLNLLDKCDAVFVLGAPSPPQNEIYLIHGVLSDSIYELTPQKRYQWFSADSRPYRITRQLYDEQGGKVPFRDVRGYWSQPGLHAVFSQYRESEILQAVHRARVNIRQADVWLLTSIPINEEVDQIMSTVNYGPHAITNETWLLIEPWLAKRWEAGQPVGRNQLAEAAGVTVDYVNKQRWLHHIFEYQKNRWDWEDDPDFPKPRRGPTKQRLKAID